LGPESVHTQDMSSKHGSIYGRRALLQPQHDPQDRLGDGRAGGRRRARINFMLFTGPLMLLAVLVVLYQLGRFWRRRSAVGEGG
jgi:hypothetical protein